jgi:hypothetical protein
MEEEAKGYQIKISLQGVKPPIWRRVEVPEDIPLEIFHQVIQIAMGWDDYHLHLFKKDNKIYILPDDEEGLHEEENNEEEFKLNDILKTEGDIAEYHYDFGDSWLHEILLEAILDDSPGDPVCVAGERACPPEDLGGPAGYADFLEAMKDPKHPMHQEFTDWIGDEFDPEEFDLELTNGMLEDFAE